MNRHIQVAFKRVFDIISLTVLTLLSPLMALITLVICLAMGHPISFRQPHLGYRGRPFTLHTVSASSANSVSISSR